MRFGNPLIPQYWTLNPRPIHQPSSFIIKANEGFLWWPKKLGGTLRWLEQARWVIVKGDSGVVLDEFWAMRIPAGPTDISEMLYDGREDMSPEGIIPCDEGDGERASAIRMIQRATY